MATCGDWSNSQLAAAYKSRWRMEFFFKWIKQHWRMKKVLGTNENAVKTQIWCAVSTYVLIAIVKKGLHVDRTPHMATDIDGVDLRENRDFVHLADGCQYNRNATHRDPVEFV